MTHVPQLRHNVSDRNSSPVNTFYIMNKIVHANSRALICTGMDRRAENVKW